MAKKSLAESIITPVVSLVCTAAICITGAVCVNKAVNKDVKKDGSVSISAELDDAYLTEAEAAEYLGIAESRLVIIRKNLKKLEGAYMKYTFVDEDGKDVEVVMYQKDKLDDAMADLMEKQNSLNFKFLEEALEKAEANKKADK